MVTNFQAELEVATTVVRQAGRSILTLYEGAAVSTKADGSVVTDADYASDAAIRAGLTATYPGDAILTEEGADDPARLTNPRCWIADPIDGTAYFVAKSDDFDVFLALAVAGRPVVAVSYQPVTGLLLSAVAGGGAWIERPDSARERLTLPTTVGPRVIATKRWLGAPANLPVLNRIAGEIGNTAVIEATRSLCARAFLPGAGSVDVMAAVPIGSQRVDSWEWDIAAVDLIVREAGGAATDLRGEPLRYNRPIPRFDQGFLISRDPELHARVLTGVVNG